MLPCFCLDEASRGALLALLLLGLPAVASAQSVSPSLYTGFGTGTHLGGLVGVGTEVRVGNHVSASVAVGAWPDGFRGEVGGASPVDFDLGVKVYPFETWVYAGVNYGTIDAQVVEEPLIAAGPRNLTTVVSEMRLKKTRGFTFSIGARTPPWRRFYASAFVGVTGNADVNNLNVFADDPDPDFFPRFGLLLGYELPFGREGS
jgi:hypothetical protein